VTTILHVEDDPCLADTVKESFKSFGFTGTYLVAHTVEEAARILDTANEPDPELIITDMNLPDGTGLDVVRRIRSDAARRHIPIVILSGEIDPSIVKDAYALGANTYLGKSVRGVSIAETMKGLYAYWLKDAQLPAAPSRTTRTFRYAAMAVTIRTQLGAAYARIAEKLGVPDGEIWMNLALREGNLANVLTFLVSQLGTHEIPDDVLDPAEAAQRVQAHQLAILEQQQIHTRDAADRYMSMMISNFQADVLAHALAHFFPVVPVAMNAMRAVATSYLNDLATDIATRSSDSQLHSLIPKLRSDAARIRT
jgi:CheY-like chemotaxis protein